MALVGAAARLASRRAFTVEGARVLLTLRPLETEPAPAPEAVFTIAGGGSSALVGLSGWSMAALLPSTRGLDPERLPLGLRLAILDVLVRPALDGLAGLLGGEVILGEPQGRWPDSGRTLRFVLEISSDGARAVETVSVPLGSVQGPWHLMATLAFIPGPKANDFRGLSWPAAIVLGGLGLPAGDLGSLAPGDVLIPDDPPITEGLARLEPPGLPSADLALSPDGVKATTPLNIKEAKVADDKATAKDGVAALSDLELPLKIEAGRLTMTLAELEALVPGVVLPARNDPLKPVTVTCHGRPVARGELVDLGGGRLGVRITEVGPAPSASVGATGDGADA
jgi:type III secretion system YscQ/HrcQ family protein